MVLKGVSMVKLEKKNQKKKPIQIGLGSQTSAVVQQKQNYYIQIK